MNKKDVVKGIFDFIEKDIRSFDFRYNSKEECFIKNNSNALFVFDLHFYNETNIKTRAKGFLIEPFIWINVKEIEQYYKEITTNKELKTEIDFKTLGTKIAELKANPDGIHKKWNESLNLYVFEEKNINYVGWELLKHFKETALPYFQNNGNIRSVDKLFNQYPKEYSVHMSNDLFRFTKGIIAAKLNKNPKLNELLEIYSKLIIERDMPEDCKEEMERLKSILPMIGSNIRV